MTERPHERASTMPRYALICSNAGCSHKWEDFARLQDGYARCICPACGATNPSQDYAASNVKPARAWEEREGRSLQFSFEPSAIPQLKREMPSAQFNEQGDMVFTSDRQQRRVFREMAATRERYRHEEQARADRRRPTDDDIADAAKAIQQKEELARHEAR